MSDPTLQSAVMAALADNRHVHVDEISVWADAGDVVLRGTVGSPLQQVEAVRTANAVPGVRYVEDDLEVRPLGLDGLLGIDARADADTEAAVLDALDADDTVHGRDVSVRVRDGKVTLEGIVEVAAQRDRAERIAMSIPGVVHVENRLRVWLTVSGDDVAERVTDAIGRDAIVGPDQVSVVVVDNDVTLSGTVGSPEHRDAALAAAAGAPGVAHVHDAMKVRSHQAR